MTKALLAVCAALLATGACATGLTPAQEAEVDRSIAQAHSEAQRLHVRWYRGFMGDGINECTDTGGVWSPKQDLVRNGWSVRLAAAAQLASGQYMEIYSDGGSTTLVYATKQSACQQILDGLIESEAQPRR
jgi:hypothetical protein